MNGASSNTAACARRLLPSLTQFLWVALFLGIVLTDWRQTLISADGDPCWHWRMGDWMIQHHAIIRNDPFSHSRPGAPIMTKEWLSEIVFAAMGNDLGWNGIVLVAAVLIATTLAVLHWQLVAEGHEILLSTILTLLAAKACMVHWVARPHLYTLLFVVIFAWQLRWFDRGRIDARRLFIRLVPLMALWANLHGGFLSGFVLIGIYFIGSAAQMATKGASSRSVFRHKTMSLAAVGAACVLATLLNPNGWKLHQYILSFLQTPYQTHFTSEWKSANFHVSGMHGFELQLLLLGLMLIFVRRPLATTDVLLIAFWLWSGLYARRNVPIFALLVTPVLAEHLSAACREVPDFTLGRRLRRISEDVAAFSHAAGGPIPVIAFVILMLCVLAKPMIRGGRPLVETQISSTRFPVTAVNYLRDHPETVHGNMFNDYGWGGYLILTAPDYKVFVDGRNDFYGPELIRDFDDVNRVQPRWDVVLQQYKAGWTLLPRDHALNILLSLRKDWSLAYADDVAEVYVRKPE